MTSADIPGVDPEIPMLPLRLGDEGPAVADIQERLARLTPETSLTIDGAFDPHTREAVRAFQRDRGLGADGIVGPETWRTLVEAGHALGDRLLWYSRLMLRGDDVRELQQRLNQLGFDAGYEDGIFGPLVQQAVEEFQRNVGLGVDGVAGQETVAMLRRLHRDHQSGGVAVRLREREWLRRMSARGLVGASILIDPGHGPGNPGWVGPSGATEHELSWEIGRRLAARLAARGAQAMLSRGPSGTPSPTKRARLANEQGVDIVVSIGLNGLDNPAAQGSSAYYFGSREFISETGLRLAELLQAAAVGCGCTPDGRVHPMTWSILRDTRMPAVVLEPGFVTSADDERRLADPGEQERLTAALTEAVCAFFEVDDEAVSA